MLQFFRLVQNLKVLHQPNSKQSDDHEHLFNDPKTSIHIKSFQCHPNLVIGMHQDKPFRRVCKFQNLPTIHIPTLLMYNDSCQTPTQG